MPTTIRRRTGGRPVPAQTVDGFHIDQFLFKQRLPAKVDSRPVIDVEIHYSEYATATNQDVIPLTDKQSTRGFITVEDLLTDPAGNQVLVDQLLELAVAILNRKLNLDVEAT